MRHSFKVLKHRLWGRGTGCEAELRIVRTGSGCGAQVQIVGHRFRWWGRDTDGGAEVKTVGHRCRL